MLKILTTHHALPNVKSYTTVLFENLLPILKTRTKVHITWLIHRSEKLNLSQQVDPDTTILDIHDYKNALEIVQKVKPDIIYVIPGLNAPDYALALAGKFCNIPVVGGELGKPVFTGVSRIELIKTYILQFFQSSVSTDTAIEQKKFMGRGLFFIYKHLFLLRTQRAIKWSAVRILVDFFILLRLYLRLYLIPPAKHEMYNSKFAYTLHFVDNEKTLEGLVNSGFERSSLILTGLSTLDKVFQRLQNVKLTVKKDNRIRVLLLTLNLAGQGGRWSKARRDTWIKEIVTEISKHKDEMSLVVKIHPSSEILWEYQSVIRSIDPSIPVYQEGDIVDFLESADVVIFPSASTAGVCALIAKKPIIIWNFFNVENDMFLEKGLAVECKNRSDLIVSIHNAISSNPASSEKVENFLSELYYKIDGRATERICDAIMNLLEKDSVKNTSK